MISDAHERRMWFSYKFPEDSASVTVEDAVHFPLKNGDIPKNSRLIRARM